MSKRPSPRRGTRQGAAASESADAAELTLQYFHLKFNAARQLAPRLTGSLPDTFEHISLEARLEYAGEVAPGDAVTFVDRQDAPKARLQWLRTLHTRAVELSMVHSNRHQRYMTRIRVANGLKVGISAVLGALLLILNDSFADVLPTIGVVMGTLYVLAACTSRLSGFEDLAKQHLVCEKSFRELATDISAFFVSLGKQAKAQASDISLQDPSASEAGPLPNAPPTVPEDQEVPAKPYGRLPSLSGGGSTPGTLALRTVNRYSPLSEVGTESEYRLAVPSATVLNSESHDPEGINLQLQDWYRSALEYSFAHNLMAGAYQKQAQVIAYVTVSLVGLAEALLLHTLWLPPAYFGVIPGGLFLLITCMDAYLALIGVELHIQRHEAAAKSFDWLQSQMEEALICHPKDGEVDSLFALIEKYKAEVISSPPLTRRFLESWTNEEKEPIFEALLGESAGDNASLRWADEVMQSLEEEDGEEEEGA
eukprot:jgi/Tetstr1/427326/TSEL_017495.t1